MTITKGAPWGSPGGTPDVVVDTDASLRALVEAARASGRPPPTVGLTGGDLCRTLGGTGALAMTFPIDVVRVDGGGMSQWFVSHLVARSRSWTRVTVVMNAAWLGTWNPAPKAHPNDGLADVVEARLRLSELAAVRARLPLGAHLPHPRISVARTPSVSLEIPGPLVFLDGTRTRWASPIRLTVEPDALQVVI
jgi:hypothetical protein